MRYNPIEQEERLVAKANMAKIPLTANFELTPTCTMRCDMCFIQMSPAECERQGGLQDKAAWLNLAQQFRQMGTLFILLTGGEPMLHPDFAEIYTGLRKMGFILTLNTNGTLIDEHIIRLFTEYKPRRVNVTLYGASEATYDRLCHRPDGYERCMNALKLLRENDIDTKLNVSVVEKNKADYEEIFRVANDLAIPVVVNSYMFPALRSQCGGGRNVAAERISPAEAARYDLDYLAYKEKDAFPKMLRNSVFTLEHVPPEERGVTLTCRAGSSSCWINWQHTLTPCVLMEEPAFNLKEKPVAAAWEQLVEACKVLPAHDECGGCKLRSICEVCYAAAGHEKKLNGTMDYLCQMTKEKRKLIYSKLANEKD